MRNYRGLAGKIKQLNFLTVLLTYCYQVIKMESAVGSETPLRVITGLIKELKGHQLPN
jgi:hypothetical protein